MQTYAVTIIPEAFERRKRNAGLLHMFTGFLLIIKTMDWLRKAPQNTHWYSLLFLGAGFLFLFFGLWGKRLANAFTTWSKRLFILEAICFITLSFLFLPAGKPVDLTFTIVWALLCFFFYYTERKTELPAMVRLTEKGVVLPGLLINIVIEWRQIESIVLRNDYLTINKKNNKYYQFEVAGENGESFIAGFNKYAEEMIE